MHITNSGVACFNCNCSAVVSRCVYIQSANALTVPFDLRNKVLKTLEKQYRFVLHIFQCHVKHVVIYCLPS